MESKNTENLITDKSQNINTNDTNNNNGQNIIITANGITSEQTKMIEAFIMFQKFINFSPELNKQIIINNNNKLQNINNINIPLNNTNQKKPDTNNNNNINNTTNNNIEKSFDNKYNYNINCSTNDISKSRKWNPIKRNKTKNYEKSKILNNINDNINNNDNEIQNNNIRNINTNYHDRYHGKIIRKKNEEENNNNDKKTDINSINNSLKEEKQTKKIINFDDIPIKQNNLLQININNNEKQQNKKINFNLAKNDISCQNIDDIVIKPSSSNFMELLEKNLKNEKQNYLNVEIKDNKSNEPKKLPMNKDNNKKLNLEINDSSMERILKKERIKQNKEKAKEIEKKAKLNSTTNIRKVEKKIIKNKSTFDKIYFNYENNTNKSSKTNTNIDNKNI